MYWTIRPTAPTGTRLNGARENTNRFYWKPMARSGSCSGVVVERCMKRNNGNEGNETAKYKLEKYVASKNEACSRVIASSLMVQ